MKILVACLVALSLVAMACGDDNGGDGNGGAGGGPTPRGEPESLVRTDDEPLEYIINTALKRDTYELAELTLYHHVACEDSPEGDDAAPPCREAEDEGDEVEVFRLFGCRETWVRPESLPGVLDELVNRETLELERVYRPTAAVADGPDYVAVFRTSEETASPQSGTAVHVKEGRMWALECGLDLAPLIADERVASDVSFDED